MSRWDRDDSYINRATGPRHDAPGICHWCGADVPDGPRFGFEATCDRDACRFKTLQRRPVDRWLVGKEMR